MKLSKSIIKTIKVKTVFFKMNLCFYRISGKPSTQSQFSCTCA